MPRRRQPRHGSLQFWPRKKAKRIYPRQKFPSSKDVKPLGFAAWKSGMTHVLLTDNNAKSPTYGKSIIKSVTILDAPSLFVCGFRLYQNSVSGLVSVGEQWTLKFPKGLEIARKATPARKELDNNLAYDDVRLIVCTQPAKSGLQKKKPDLFELGIGGDVKQKLDYAQSLLGKELHARDVMKP